MNVYLSVLLISASIGSRDMMTERNWLFFFAFFFQLSWCFKVFVCMKQLKSKKQQSRNNHIKKRTEKMENEYARLW
ncbi:hypothetical protein GGR50DRAFT_635418 [Xylaria sp. CBS 124048]|nr:hypothetical protein GGR50DRAFT_635418 [Xylaria sp. CBS 124048]